MSNKIIGIDLGTTHALVGVMDSGFPILIVDVEHQRLTPSVINFSSEILVGWPAKRKQALEPEQTIYSIKRFMGRRFSELSESEKKVNYSLNQNISGQVTIPIKGKEYLPEEISSEILKKLKANAERELSQTITRAVITVPAYFNDAQRNATKRAGELAGLTVERILNEPTAAALAYGLDQKKQRGLIAVYDLGGGTFDLSILELNLGVFEVRSTHGNTRLGGDDIDEAISQFLWKKIEEQGFHGELDSIFKARLKEESERAKIALSTQEIFEINLPFLKENFNFSFVFNRKILNELAKPIVDQTREHCFRALSDAKIKPEFLDEVILVGGQTRMPLVRETVREIFGKEPNISMNPDEAVALGAVLQAGILEGNVSNMVLLDVTPLSLGIETFGGLMNVIIPRNSTIPIKAGEMFTTAVDYQRAMKIHVLQGEREMAKDNWSLGQFELEFTSAPRGVPRVGVQFEMDADGILKVLARDTQTGREKRLELESAIEVSDEKVEEMLADSLTHAFEDVSQRRWVEAELKAKEMLEATQKALDLLQSRLSQEELKCLQDLMGQVSNALESRSLELLKKTNEALDEGTQALAEKMMDLAAATLFQEK